MGRLERILIGCTILGLGAAAIGSETITYSYDNLGRLVRVVHKGSFNNGVQTNYSYDKADNRTNKTTTGAPK